MSLELDDLHFKINYYLRYPIHYMYIYCLADDRSNENKNRCGKTSDRVWIGEIDIQLSLTRDVMQYVYKSSVPFGGVLTRPRKSKQFNGFVSCLRSIPFILTQYSLLSTISPSFFFSFHTNENREIFYFGIITMCNWNDIHKVPEHCCAEDKNEELKKNVKIANSSFSFHSSIWLLLLCAELSSAMIICNM